MYSFVFGLLKTNLIDFSMLQSDFDDSDLKDDSLMDVDETPEVEMPVAEGETQVKTEAVEGEEVEVKEETLDESVKMEMTENEIEIKEENIPEKTENDSVRDLFQKSILIKDFFHELNGSCGHLLHKHSHGDPHSTKGNLFNLFKKTTQLIVVPDVF